MEVKATIKLQEKDLFSFNMYHSYHRFQTWGFLVLGLVLIGVSLYTFNQIETVYSLFYIAAGLLFIFYTPYNLKLSAKHAMKRNDALNSAMEYVFNKNGITVGFASQEAVEGDDTTEDEDEDETSGVKTHVTWKEIYKVVNTKKAIYLYTSPRNASILPKDQLEGKLDALQNVIKENVESFRL